jgi:hypothetical protein
MNNKEYETVLNQYIDILMYDIHIKNYELKKINQIPNILTYYFNIIIKKKLLNLRKISIMQKKFIINNYDVDPKPPSFLLVDERSSSVISYKLEKTCFLTIN